MEKDGSVTCITVSAVPRSRPALPVAVTGCVLRGWPACTADARLKYPLEKKVMHKR